MLYMHTDMHVCIYTTYLIICKFFESLKGPFWRRAVLGEYQRLSVEHTLGTLTEFSRATAPSEFDTPGSSILSAFIARPDTRGSSYSLESTQLL